MQSPSMLDNVSTQDFNGDSADDIQRQVQDALTQNEMKKMEIVEPSPSSSTSSASTFMASPAPPAPAASPTEATVPAEDTSAPAQEPFNVASLETPKVEMPPVSDADGSVPRPLTPEEDKQAVIDAENAPTSTPIVSVSSPVEPATSTVSPSPDGVSTGSDTFASASSDVASTALDTPTASDQSSSDASSPSAPVEPPAAPPPLPDPIVADEPSSDEFDDSDDSDDSATDEEPVQDTEDASSSSEEDVPSELPAPLAEPDTTSADMNTTTSETSEESDSEETKSDEDDSSSSLNSTGIPAVDTSKLAALKQHALDHLEPLADQLDQSPEEEFRTTMMRIQANDNHTLLEKALNAAKKIEDGSARAKALLDIINEINYFAQTSEEVN